MVMSTIWESETDVVMNLQSCSFMMGYNCVNANPLRLLHPQVCDRLAKLLGSSTTSFATCQNPGQGLPWTS